MAELRSREEIAAEIRRLRGGTSLAEFAKLAGKPGQGPQFGKYEAAKVPPSLETLRAIAQAAGVPMSIFYRNEGRKEKPLTLSDVVQVRDQIEAASLRIDEALRILEAALGGEISPVPRASSDDHPSIPDPLDSPDMY